MGTAFTHRAARRRETGIFPLMIGLVLAIAPISAGCLGGSYDAKSNGATVSVKPGEEIRISLDETPSTGYVWNVTLTGGLVLTKTGFGSPGSLSGMPGADSGTRTWVLTAGDAPVQGFSALKMRRGDDPSRAVDRFGMTFRVDTGTP